MNSGVKSMKPNIEPFFDKNTCNVTYVVSDPQSSACAIIDSVLDYDPASGRTSKISAGKVIEYVRHHSLQTQWILETHVHADHLTASALLKKELGGKTGIGKQVTAVQEVFGPIFNAGSHFATDGSQFDHLFADDETFSIGALGVKVMHTPGHTPACCSYLVGDAVFVGDTLFMPDSGTARCDFPKGDPAQLYRSIQQLLELPAETRMFVNHDYGCGGTRPFAWETTVGEQRTNNIHVKAGTSEGQYIETRRKRDATLAFPKLILPSVQVNMRAGNMPPAEENGTSYLRIPIDAL